MIATDAIATLRVDAVAGASACVAARAADPLKLLVNRPRGPAVWAFLGTYGGGLLAGDRAVLAAEVGPGARLVIATQAPGKAYPSPDGRWAEQDLRLDVAADGLGALLTDPTVCYAGARWRQRVALHLEARASACWLDVLAAGRVARGERWAFAAVDTAASVHREGRLLWREALQLGTADIARLGPADAWGTLLLLGPLCQTAAQAALDEAKAEPAGAGADGCVLVAAPMADGALLRCAGPDAGAVEMRLRSFLVPLHTLFDGDPAAHRR